MADREIYNSQDISAINYSNSQPINDYFNNMPFQFYPPFWKFPFFNFPPNLLYKPPQFGCKYCRPTSFRSVMTQTAEKLEDSQVEVSMDGEQNFGSALLPLLTDQFYVVKSEQKQEEEGNINGRNIQPEAKIQAEDNQIQVDIIEVGKQENKKDLGKDSVFHKMLALFMVNPSQYQNLVSENINSSSDMAQLVKYFHDKLCSFKKSKEEMIKLIIRKTQRHYKMQNNCKRDERFKKFGGFKSMNSIYLEKLFSDPSFTQSYMEVINTFIDQFKTDNLQKLGGFLQKVYSCANSVDLKAAMKSLDEKNKMPWPTFWVQKLRKVSVELMANFVKDGSVRAKGPGKQQNEKKKAGR